MNRADLPFVFFPSRAVVDLLGKDLKDLRAAAVMAVRAVLRHRKSLEIAHQQIMWGEHHLAFSTRIGAAGDLIVELEVGDASLRGCIVLEDDFQKASTAARVKGAARSSR